MLKYIVHISVLFSLGCASYTTYNALKLAWKAQGDVVQYQRAYESALSELESVYRTKGMNIDTNYSCKLKSGTLKVVNKIARR